MNLIQRIFSGASSFVADNIRTPEQNRLERKVDAVAQIRENIAHWSSDRELKRIWNEIDSQNQKLSLEYLGITLTQLYLAQEVDRQLGKTTDDFVYAARARAIVQYETQIIPRYEVAFGPIHRTEYGRRSEAA